MRHAALASALLAALLPGTLESAGPDVTPPRERLLMDAGWRFAFGHPYDAEKDFRHGTGYFSYFAKSGYGDGPASPAFDDRAWRKLDLPHDWAVEAPFDSRGGHSHGYKAVGRSFPEASVGWYRRSFFVPASDLGRRISVELDGVHRDSVVWVNGFYLGREPSGYASSRYDVTDYLRYGDRNVVAVRVDATMEEGWYYEGAGIYRHVWLVKTAPLHVAPHGTFVSSTVAGGGAEVSAGTTIINEGVSDARFAVAHEVLDAGGATVATAELAGLTLARGEERDFPCRIAIPHVRLWSLATPHLYTLVTTLRSGGAVVDRYETSFGVRTLRFDPKEGFFLNGEHVILKGTNNHQDHAGVGTALPDALQEFRLGRLKEMGSNAYRSSHNPPTPELLDACDRLGMLVIDENRLMGSNPEHLGLLRRMILRDRNHPSVILWSLGNEEWAIEGNETGARIASTMQAFARGLDPTRRTTVAGSGGWGHGISTVIDVMGFNYIFNGDIDKQHAGFPSQPGVGTEESTTRMTRGIYENDPSRGHSRPSDREPEGRGLEAGFQFYAARPFLAGLFFWTGFDYRGEANPYGWPQVISQSGILDLCGFPKDTFHYLKAWWTAEPVLHVSPHWNWSGKEGQAIDVRVFSSCDAVELLLNGRSLGRKTMVKGSHLEWQVPYAPGTLLARGYTGGREVALTRVETAGAPAALELVPDRATIGADGRDVAVVTVQVKDARGRIAPTAGDQIVFALAGPGRIIGVGNGDPGSHEVDRFIESVHQIGIAGLKVQAAEGPDASRAIAADVDDSEWRPATNPQGEYVALEGAQVQVIRGVFVLPALGAGAQMTLFPKSLAEEQAIYVNGRRIAEHVKRDGPPQELALDRSLLREGRNAYAIVGPPLVKRRQWETLNTDAGVIRVVTPAERWKRQAFQGLAQVIVQATREPGEIVLTAEAQGLTAGVVKLQARPAALRPAVPVP